MQSDLPCVATLSIGKPISCAMLPMMAKMTNPAKMLVSMSPVATTSTSLMTEREGENAGCEAREGKNAGSETK